jgi:hypothetical protein
VVHLHAGQLGRQRCAFGLLAGLGVWPWRGRQTFQLLLDGSNVGINGFIEQTGLGRIKLFAASSELAKRFKTAIS